MGVGSKAGDPPQAVKGALRQTGQREEREKVKAHVHIRDRL